MSIQDMERRGFLKLAFGVAAGAGLLAAAASPAGAAPLISADLKSPAPGPRQAGASAEPAVATERDLDDARAEQVRWGRRRGRRRWRPRFRRRRFYY